MQIAKMVLIAVVVLGLIVLYATMAVGSWVRSTRKDLRPGRRERTATRLSGGGGDGGVGGRIGDRSGQLRRRVRALR